MAVCKDDDRLHLERIDADKTAAKALMERASRASSKRQRRPRGISTDPVMVRVQVLRTRRPVPWHRSTVANLPQLQPQHARTGRHLDLRHAGRQGAGRA